MAMMYKNKILDSESQSMAQSISREKMAIQSYGILHEVDKKQWMKEFNKSVGIGVFPLRNSTK